MASRVIVKGNHATSNTDMIAKHVKLKGTYRDQRVTGALNFHKIRDF